MALNKRFVFSKKSHGAFDLSKTADAHKYLRNSSDTVKSGVTDKELESIIFAGANKDDKKTRDIIVHGYSWVQEPLRGLETDISGLDQGAIATTNVSQVAENAVMTGLTLDHLNTAVSQLNTYIGNVSEDAGKNYAVAWKKLGSSDDLYNAKWASQYRLYQGKDDSGNFNTPVPNVPTIDIPKDQFLKAASFIAKATDTDHTAQSSVVVGDPYLKFEWQLDASGESETDNVVTYVPVKELVDVYCGYKNVDSVNATVYSKSGNSTSSKSFGVETTLVDAVENANDTMRSTLGNGGKGIKVTLDNNTLNALAQATVAESNANTYTNEQIQDVEDVIGTNSLDASGASIQIGHTLSGKVVPGEGESPISATGKDAVLGSATGQYTVAGAITGLNDEINKLAVKIKNIEGDGEGDTLQALKTRIDSLAVNGEKFSDDENYEITLTGNDIEVDENALSVTSGSLQVFASTDKSLTISEALVKLDQAWAWEEIV